MCQRGGILSRIRSKIGMLCTIKGTWMGLSGTSILMVSNATDVSSHNNYNAIKVTAMTEREHTRYTNIQVYKPTAPISWCTPTLSGRVR